VAILPYHDRRRVCRGCQCYFTLMMKNIMATESMEGHGKTL
jgi:hypothetical protein